MRALAGSRWRCSIQKRNALTDRAELGARRTLITLAINLDSARSIAYSSKPIYACEMQSDLIAVRTE